MSRDSLPPQVQLIGVLLVGLVAIAWAFTSQEAQSQQTTVPQESIFILYPRVVNWTYFITSVLLLAASLFSGCFDFINNKKQGCHPNCSLLFIALAVPGLASLGNLDGSNNLSMGVQLIMVASMYCVIASSNPQDPPNRSFITLIRRFLYIDLGLQIFLVYSIIISTFSLFPDVWSAVVPSRFWEARVVGLDGVLALGSAMAALLGYQIIDYLPPKSGSLHVLCYLLCTIGTVLPVNSYRTFILTVPVVLQIVGIFWDILIMHQSQAAILRETQEERRYFQSASEQLQALNNISEVAITTKSAFLSGLANEMKSIVHGTSMVMSMLNDTDLQPNQVTYLARLDRAVDRLTNLVKEAQYYFEVESQKSTTDTVPFRLDQMLEEVINSTSIRTHLEERDVDVTYIVDTSVPMCLLGDYSRLKNILLRLLTNAIKATVQGEIVIWVRSPQPTPAPGTPVAVTRTPSNSSLTSSARFLSNSSGGKPTDLKMSKLISSDQSISSPPSTPTREVSPRSSLYSGGQSGSPRNVRSPRTPYNISVNTSTETDGGSSPRGVPATPKSNHTFQRSSSLNSVRSATPKSAAGVRPSPEFTSESTAHNLLSPPTSPLNVSTVSSPNLHILRDSPTPNDDTVQLSISVVDTGIGIPPEDLARIFEPFAMVNRKREDTDLGLGLSICKQLARLFGGNLTVQSELSRGTSFTLTCPFRVNANTQLQNINSIFGPGSMLQRAWGIGKTICVIDNNASIGAVCKMHLVPVGCDVLYYATTAEAIAQMKVFFELGRVCDAVLVGYRLYGTNGEETAKFLRSDPDLHNVPIVLMCTAKQRKQITLPNVHYLYKPLKKEQLLTVVHMLCTTQPHQPAPPSPESFHEIAGLAESRSPRISPLSASSPAIPRPNSNKMFPPLSLPSLPSLPEQEEPSPPQPRKNISPVNGADRPVERHEHRANKPNNDNNTNNNGNGNSNNGNNNTNNTNTNNTNNSNTNNTNSTNTNNNTNNTSNNSNHDPSPPLPTENSNDPTSPFHVQDQLMHVQQLRQEQQQLQQQLLLQQATDKMQDLQLQQPLPPPIKVTDISQQNGTRGEGASPRAQRADPPPRAPLSASASRTQTRTSSPDMVPTPIHRRASVSFDNIVPPPPQASPPQDPPGQTAPHEAATPAVPKKETILLVEDNPINAKIASAVLRRHQFEVELAGNGQVALEKVKLAHGNFQLILMDIHMPVMDGLTCARLVRQFESEHNLEGIPIIALTADATSLHRTACLEAGCNEFMSKPLDYPLLIEILKKLSAGGSLLS